MSRKNIIPVIILPFFLLNIARGQEIVSGLQVIKEIKSFSSDKASLKSKGLTDTLELPIFDDFSNSLIYPDDTLWSDNEVYINNTLALDQPSIGVATFDALNSSGLLYEDGSSIRFEADHLTSNPINLEGDASDNFYLSFLYQPQGIMDQPEPGDSLTLEFYSVSDAKWYSIWRAEGTEVHPFKTVIISIDDSKFTNRGFKFRFTNYATLSSTINDPGMIGNADHWHIDYVYLDRNRNPADTVIRDVAFSKPLRSVLPNFESMPWEQFKLSSLAEMGDSINNIWIINNDSTERNVTRDFVINDIYQGGTVYQGAPAAKNIDSGASINFGARIIYTFNSSSLDSALFEITTSLTTDIFDKKINDTLRYQQVFSNYYSVDDGSAENGYGITANNAMAVYRYHTPTPDTIRAVDICFNDSYLNANQRYFELIVLSSDNKSPGDIIYSQEEAMVDPGESINGFIRYRLDEAVHIDDEFFIGWRQVSNTYLNAGLDMNTPPRGRQYYYVNGEWFTSQVGGSLMIRPVVGKPLLTTGIDDILNKTNSLNIWPNPVNDILNIEDKGLFDRNNTRINIYNSAGSIILSQQYSESLNLSSLPGGAYILVITQNKKVYSKNKFIKSR